METTAEIETKVRNQLHGWILARPKRLFLYFLFGCAALIFTRCYMFNTTSYLNIDSYLAGTERLPYQRRVFPMIVLRALLRLPFPHVLSASNFAIFAHPAFLYLLGLNLLSFCLTGYFATALYRRLAPEGRLGLLVFPVLLFASMWTYLMRPLFGTNLPYDLPSQAFFAAGLLCIYSRRFWWLLVVVAVGTFNRETTLFLIILYVIDVFATRASVSVFQFPWLCITLLSLVWIAIRSYLGHLYTTNDAGETFLRVRVNAHLLIPDNYPQILTACGFLLPVVWILRRQVPDRRLAAWIYILPIWVAVMVFYGVLNESRIFGELCSLVAVVSVLLLEKYSSDLGLAQDRTVMPQ